MNDYYAILGIGRTATPEEIKKAYRRASRENHPDIAGDDPQAEERFKDINAAYEVLSDPEKREMYDLGVDPLAPGGGGAPGGAGGFSFDAAGFGGFGDIFETLFTAAAGGTPAPAGPISRAQRGRDQLERLTIDLADAVFGTEAELDFSTYLLCGECQGSCCAPGTSPVRCSLCGGSGHTERIVRSLLGSMRTQEVCRQCQGYGDIITTPCPECSGHGRVRGRKTVTVRVPAGIDTGNRMRVGGKGEAGPGGGPNGDLYVDFKVRNHSELVRDGDTLICTLPLPMTAAALGTTLEIQTLDGPQEITVKPGTQPRETITLEGLGVGRLNGKGRGDLTVVLDVKVPTDLDSAQEELLRRFAADRGEERPVAELASTGGWVSRLKDKLTGK